MKKQVKITGFIAVFLAAVLIITTVFVVFTARSGFQGALNPARYHNVQVADTFKSERIGEEKAADDTSIADTSDGEYYGETDESSNEDSDGTSTITTMKKAGDIIFETGLNGDYYFYTSDRIQYVLRYDKAKSPEKDGIWVQIPMAESNLSPLFDFYRLKKLSKKDFIKQGDVYTPITDRKDDIFFILFGISDSLRYQYEIADLQVKVENGLLQSIMAVYYFYEKTVITRTLTFSYDNINLTLPKAQNIYKGS